MKRLITIAAMLTVAFCAMAQTESKPKLEPQDGGRPPRPEGNFAQMKAERMKQELSLDDKQYKKVLKVFEQEESSMHPQGGGMPGGGPGMGGPGGMPGGGPGMGGPGGMPGGGPGGMGGPGGGPGMGQGGQRPQGPPPGMQQLSDEEMEKIMEKKESQLRKILTTEQFDKWAEAHPEEFSLPMPDLEQ